MEPNNNKYMQQRKIKFRAWWVDKMMNWDEIKEKPMQMLEYATGIKFMQYTGLKDKNGKEIYEGDIAKREKGNLLKGEQWNEIIREIKYNNWHGGFCWADWRLDGNMIKEIEVIGNIYENKDLIK